MKVLGVLWAVVKYVARLYGLLIFGSMKLFLTIVPNFGGLKIDPAIFDRLIPSAYPSQLVDEIRQELQAA